MSWDLFELLHVTPGAGTRLQAEEDTPGKNNVIVLSHGMWQRRFGADPNVLGKSVTLNGAPSTIVGVMPPGFYFPSRQVEFWAPIAIDPANASRGGHFLGVVARLKPGVSQQQAEAEMKTIAERLAQQYPRESANESAEIVALHEQVVGNSRPALLTLLAAVGVVVLIACANVANLLLVRASVREKEIAIRIALGAGRRRLVLQMLSESLVLSLAGGALGLLLAYLAIGPIRTLSAGSIPRVDDIAIDTTVLAFALAVSLLTGLLFGLAPAWQAGRGGVGEALKEGGRSSSLAGGRWVRSGLLIAEVALSIVLLVGATLLLRSFARLTDVDPGFRPDNVLAFRVALPNTSYPEDHHRIAFFDRLLERLDALPQVTAAGMVQTLPMRGDYFLSFDDPGTAGAEAWRRAVGQSPRRQPRLSSRRWASHCSAAAPSPRRTRTRRRWSPWWTKRSSSATFRTKIRSAAASTSATAPTASTRSSAWSGRSTTTASMRIPVRRCTCRSSRTCSARCGSWCARPATRPCLSPVARQTVREIDPGLPAYAMTPLADGRRATRSRSGGSRCCCSASSPSSPCSSRRSASTASSPTPSASGRRRSACAWRSAPSAATSSRLVVGGGMKLALVGVAIGIVAALALSGVVRTLLFGVTPFDGVSYAATVDRAARRRGARVLRARAAGDARRSDHRAAERVVAMKQGFHRVPPGSTGFHGVLFYRVPLGSGFAGFGSPR